MSSCSAVNTPAAQITVQLEAAKNNQDESAVTSQTLQVPLGSTVAEVLAQANITLGPLDRVSPPLYEEATDNLHIKVTRRREEFLTEKRELPFQRQIVKNLNLPVGETRLLQAGENGLEEITIRKVYEDGVLISSYPLKNSILKEPVVEILMVGIQQPFTPQPIAGKLAYLSGGNAWVMSSTTAERKPLITTGKLDGRIFSLSPDGEWLLFTQKEEGEGAINSLWVIQTTSNDPKPITLGVKNVVHYADWVPQTTLRIAFSTVEPRSTPPGWQANNDLYTVDFSPSGWVSKRTEILPAQVGGIYGWWGTTFLWAPDGYQCAYSRADQIGLVSFSEKTLKPLLNLLPFQTYSDWAWIPSLRWSPDGKLLYYVEHRSTSQEEQDESSPTFDISALTAAGISLPVIQDSGMFAFPSPSPLIKESGEEEGYLFAYLKAIFPQQSQSSRYRLFLADRDGSNKRLLFPPEDWEGLEPQQIFWSPQPIYGKMRQSDAQVEKLSYAIAVVYHGDIWLIEAESGKTHQITADGLISKIDWK